MVMGWCGAALIFAVLALAVVSMAAATPQTVTLRVPAEDIPKLAKVEVLDRIDYGGFSIVEVPAAAVDTLKAKKARFHTEKSAGVIGLQDKPFNVIKGKTPAVLPGLSANETPGSPILYLIHLKGPVKKDWVQEIEKSGAKIVSYIPENTYLVWADPSKAKGIGNKSFVRWKGAYHPAYKIQNKLEGLKGKVEYLSVTIYDDPSGAVVKKIGSMGAKLVRKLNMPLARNIPATNAWFSADASLINKIAKLPKVLRIEKASLKFGLDDEIACQIAVQNHNYGVPFSRPPYLDWLNNIGYDGMDSVVAIVDTGCDTNNPSTIHQDLSGRISTVLRYQYTPEKDLVGHGTHVAGIIAGTAAKGTVDDNDFRYGQGIAPGCNLVIQNAVLGQFPPMGGWEVLTQDSVRNNAFISNNSWFWDNELGLGYTALCREFDLLVRDADRQSTGAQPLVMVFSSGNAGPNMNSIYEPKEAKNIITVGASENYRLDEPLPETCGESGNIDGVASFSSRGPCKDGRLAPTIVAPGANIASLLSYSAAELGKYNDPSNPCKKAIDADYAWMSGTSQAAPLVTGALAVIGQWWRNLSEGKNPSPAMCKAILVNSAKDMANGPDGRNGILGHIPNGDQGWGRLDLSAAINSPDTYYEDQKHLFTNTGQIRRYRVNVADPSRPLKITLAWSDAPGAPGANAWVNDLDLTVTGQSGDYIGNDFLAGWSTVGGSRDYKNNVECVYLPNPSGVYWVTVTAANITGDGVPGNSIPLDQDYALVIRNGNIGGNELQPYAPVIKDGALSADYYTAEVVSGGWCAVGVRSAPGSDYDLSVYSDAGYDNIAAASQIRGETIDFVAVDGNREIPDKIFPKVEPYTGTSGYTVEWATRTSDLSPGVAQTVSFTNQSILMVWDIDVSQPSHCGITVTPDPGLDIGVTIIGSTIGDFTTYYQPRVNKIAEADINVSGGMERIDFVLPASGRYAVVVWSKGGLGNITLRYDNDPPTQPIVDTPFFTTNLNTLSASWQSDDPDTGIVKYEYSIGTAPGADDTVGWTNVSTATQATRSGLALISGQEYYFNVRATNGIGMTSIGSSGPIYAVTQVSDIAAAKTLADGDGVILGPKVITAVFNGKFYIEEASRHSGIGVLWSNPVEEGSNVIIIGKLTIIANERFITAWFVYPLSL